MMWAEINVRNAVQISAVVIASLVLGGCGGGNPRDWVPIDDNGWRERGQTSADVHQGLAYNYGELFLFHTDAIERRNENGETIARVLLPQLQHIGDGDYHGGRLFAPIESWRNGCNYENPGIAVIDADTLEPIRTIDISANGHEAAGITVVPEHNALYVVSYCEGNYIWKYDLDTFALVDMLALSQPIDRSQGIDFDADRGVFYVSGQNAVYEVSQAGEVSIAFTHEYSGDHEGIDYQRGTISLLIDNGGDRRILHVSRM